MMSIEVTLITKTTIMIYITNIGNNTSNDNDRKSNINDNDDINNDNENDEDGDDYDDIGNS